MNKNKITSKIYKTIVISDKTIREIEKEEKIQISLDST